MPLNSRPGIQEAGENTMPIAARMYGLRVYTGKTRCLIDN
jgi:hypothetical protein